MKICIMKTSKQQRRNGFTLLELVAVLILTAISLAFSAMLIVTTTSVTVENKHAVEDSQKIQAAMNRLVKELTFAKSGTIVVANGRSIQWTSRHPGRLGESGTVSWDGVFGSNIGLSTPGLPGAVLLDNAAVFSVSATSDSISLTMKSARAPGVEHSMVIHPR